MLYLVDFPNFNSQSYKARDAHDCVRVIIQNVQKHNRGLKDVEEYRSDGQPLQGLSVVPELDVYQRKIFMKRYL